MKKLFLIFMFIILSCSLMFAKSQDEISLNYDFTKITKESKGTTVNIYMYGGAEEINDFMDNVIAKNLKQQNNITLNIIPIINIKDIVNKLIIEKQAGKKNGSVDVLWVNGENFKNLKKSNVLWGDFIKSLPNLKYVKSSTYEKDFGENINGLEAPWGEAQFNFIYNSAVDKNIPFTDAKTLLEYAKKNQGKFAYPTVVDHTGSAFVRNIAVDILGYNNIEKMSNKVFEQNLEAVWKYFSELRPYLWRKGETYPEGEAKVDTLFLSGEINIAMGYTVNKVNSKISSGGYPETAKSFLLNKGTLFNNHYLTIPANAGNKSGAIFVINYLLSPEAQILKQDPKNWGDFTILDTSKISPSEKNQLNKYLTPANMPSFSELEKKRVKELSPEKLKLIDEGWLKNIGRKN
ncbi:MAG: ABC transporter substrate-binding protein [Fusobacteriaceae bacterium]